MVFKMSPAAKAVESLMDAQGFIDEFIKGVDGILELIEANADMDHKNDRVRGEVTQHLLQGMTSANMRSFEDVNKHIHAALQKLHSQEAIDLRDDKPRVDAQIKLSVMRESGIRLLDQVRNLTGELDNIRLKGAKNGSAGVSES